MPCSLSMHTSPCGKQVVRAVAVARESALRSRSSFVFALLQVCAPRSVSFQAKTKSMFGLKWWLEDCHERDVALGSFADTCVVVPIPKTEGWKMFWTGGDGEPDSVITPYCHFKS